MPGKMGRTQDPEGLPNIAFNKGIHNLLNHAKLTQGYMHAQSGTLTFLSFLALSKKRILF